MKRDGLIRRYFEMANADDAEGMYAMYAPDGVFNPPGRLGLKGEAIKKYLEGTPMAYKYHHDTPLRIWEVDQFNFVEILGEIETKEGTSTKFVALEIIEFDADNKFLSVTPYWDNYQIMKDLGYLKRK